MFELIDFFEFVKKPQYDMQERRKTHVLKTALKVSLICFFAFGLIGVLAQFILGLFFTLPKDGLEEFLKSMNIGRWEVFVIMTFLGPVLEEVIFRLPLLFKIQYINFIFAVIIGIIIHYLIPYLPLLIVTILLFFIFSSFVPKYEKKIFEIWVRYFRYIVWLSAIIFGLVHIGNFQLINGVQYFIVPFLVLPQLGMGFVLSYVRLNYRRGFLIGLFVHVFINSVGATVFLLQASTQT